MNSLLELIKIILGVVIAICWLAFFFNLVDLLAFKNESAELNLKFIAITGVVSYILLMVLPKTRREKIEVFTISEIGKEYQVLGAVSATSSSSFKNVKLKLQTQADRLSADAIIGMIQNNESIVSGSVSSWGSNVSGKTETKTKYHMHGTAIKYINNERDIDKQAGKSKNSKKTGKFLNYDSNTGNGTIMLSDNTKMEFKIDMWDDPELIPVAGMSDLNIYSDNGRIRIMSKEYTLEKLEASLN